MSDSDIPFEIQTEIIQRIPDIKSVIRCRSVSKAWKSVIDSKDFVTAHTLRHQAHNRHHLLIRKRDGSDKQVKYASILDDDTFPHQKLNVFVPDSLNNFCDDSIKLFSHDFVIILGSSHGLFCVYGEKTSTAIIWNPTIRKTIEIAVPKEPEYFTVVGFGICPSNLDPKLVKISYVSDSKKLQDVNASTQVEVFTLSSGGTWRSPLSNNLPHKSIEFGRCQAGVDGFIYWSAMDNVGGGYTNPKLIMSFDLATEEFTKVNLPDPLALGNPLVHLPLYNLRGSLAILEIKFIRDFNSKEICHVWMMIGHGYTRSFNKLYSIDAPDALIRIPLGFRKSGAPIIQMDNYKEDYYKYEHALAMYEPESTSITNIGVYGLRGTFFVQSYMETLLLLGH